MSMVPIEKIRGFLDIAETDNSKDDVIVPIHNGVESYAKEYLQRDPESTTYSQKYDGPGDTILLLKEYPVTALTRVSIAFEDVIKIENTSSDVDNCYVTVDSDSLLLTISGGANDGTDDLTFASYATMSAMVTQINAVGKGWDAAIVNTDYNNLKTTSLLEVYNLPCGAPAGSTAIYKYLYWGEPISVTLDADDGKLYYSGGFPKGFQNVLVNYTAGYSAASMPARLQLPIMTAVSAIWRRRDEDGFAVSNYTMGRMTVKYLDVFAELEKQLEMSKDTSKQF